MNRSAFSIRVFYVIILFCYEKSYAQSVNISGSVQSIFGRNLPYSSIGFYKKDSLVKGTIADSLGGFRLNIDQGYYTLKVSALNTLLVNEINLLRDTVLHITLSDSGRLLDEVTVKGVQPTIEYKVDRTVFNVQNSLFKSGLNGVDLLKQVPRLEMSTDDALKMAGRTGVRVMLNGRLLNLSERAVIGKLESLRSEDILKVEIIPTPPSKYSAEGNVGYINIVLKKDETGGFQFRPFFEYTQRQYPSGKLGMDINFKSPKINLSFSPFYETMRVVNSNKTSYNFYNKQQLSLDRFIKLNSDNLSGSLILVYSITERLELGLVANAGKNNISSSELTSTRYKNAAGEIDSAINANAPSKEKNNELGLTAYAAYKIDSLGKKISLTYNNSLNTNATIKNVSSELYYPSIALTRFNDLENTGDIKFRINSSMLDFELPYSFAKIETGLSYTDINNNSFLRLSSGDASMETISSNDVFDYYEHTVGAYTSIEKPFNKLSAKLGLRYERSVIEGKSHSTALNNRSSYEKLFPTVNLSYAGIKDNFLSFAYSKRIERPNFFYLNPFRYYTSPYAYTSGNALLLPSFTDNFELMHVFKNSLTAITTYSKKVNGINYVSLYEEGNNFTVPQNNLTQKKWDLMLIYQKAILSWWTTNPVLNLYYSKNWNTGANTGLIDQKGSGGMLLFNNTFTISKAKNIFVQGNYMQFFPSQFGFERTKAFGYFSSNIRFPLFRQALQCMVSFADFFKTNRITYTQQYHNYLFQSYSDPGFQYLSVSVSYLMGNKKLNGIYRQSKNAEKNRTNK